MQRINIFYIAVVLSGIGLFFLLRPAFHTNLSFFGFAENNETEINYNYPVVVDKIMVTPGQAVKAGDVLLHISRIKPKETLEEQPYRMEELNAEEALWRQKKESQIAETSLAAQNAMAEATTGIRQLEKELAFKKSVAEGLKTISPEAADYKPLEEELVEAIEDKDNRLKAFNLKLEGLRKELRLGKSPYQKQINRLQAEREFDAAHQVQTIIVKAPSDGLIGNISCKEEEHVPSFSTLLSFYEPHSGIIQGFVHEDMTLKVNIGDQFMVSSLKDSKTRYNGQVIGLGSRIVETPARLRKNPEFKTYGREVLIKITKENQFLQKEKVSLRFLPNKKPTASK